MFKSSRPLITVLASFAGATAVGTLSYLFTRRARGAARAGDAGAEPSVASAPVAEARESMVVSRSSVADPLTVVLDLDGIFRGEAELETAELTAQCDVKRPPPVGADDGEPPEADRLGALWLARATESERSLSEADLEIDLDNVPDFHDEAEQVEDDEAYHDEYELTAASGWPRH